MTEILGRDTGEVRERGEQEINIKDLSNRQSKERDRDRETIRETGLERERGRPTLQETETEEIKKREGETVSRGDRQTDRQTQGKQTDAAEAQRTRTKESKRRNSGRRAQSPGQGTERSLTPALWLLAPRGCTHQLGAARCPRRLHGSPSTPASGAAPASVRFPRWVSHCALLPPCAPLAALRSHRFARRGRGGGTGAGQGGRGRRERPRWALPLPAPQQVSPTFHTARFGGGGAGERVRIVQKRMRNPLLLDWGPGCSYTHT